MFTHCFCVLSCFNAAINMGCTKMHRLALSSHSMMVSGLSLTWGFSVFFRCKGVCCSSFHSKVQKKNIHVCLNGDFKLKFGVSDLISVLPCDDGLTTLSGCATLLTC